MATLGMHGSLNRKKQEPCSGHYSQDSISHVNLLEDESLFDENLPVV